MAAEQLTGALGAKQVVLDLQQELAGAREAEHQAEAAIAVYQAAAAMIDQLGRIQRAALDLAGRDMQQRGVRSLETPVGRAVWDSDTGTLAVE